MAHPLRQGEPFAGSAGLGLGITRQNLSERTLVTLRRGSWDSPDVLLVDSERGPVVVKDFSPRRRIVANSLGRWLIAREKRTLQALADHPSVPRLLGSLDGLALVLELRGGVRFSRRRPWTFSHEFGEMLAQAVEGLHDRGVVHLDLRHRSNIRAGVDGRPVLIDFDSALRFRPGSWPSRTILPLLARLDRRSVRKWQRRLPTPAGQASRASSGTTAGSVGSRGASLPTK